MFLEEYGIVIHVYLTIGQRPKIALVRFEDWTVDYISELLSKYNYNISYYARKHGVFDGALSMKGSIYHRWIEAWNKCT